jgi:PAS domain S-box-containing protein
MAKKSNPTPHKTQHSISVESLTNGSNAEDILKSILNAIEDVIYVATPDTYELVFVNSTAEKLWGENMVGQKCYKVLQNRNSPCPFCTNDIIFNSKVGEVYNWEFQNEVTKQWFRCSDKVIEWPDGRKLRFELAIDISDKKENDQKLQLLNQQLNAANQQLEASERHLKSLNQQLDASNQQLAASNQQLEAHEKELESLNSNLRERLKEINCLFKISESASKNSELEQVLTNVIDFIPPAWQYPEICVARLTYLDQSYSSTNFRESKWKQKAAIKIKDKVIGKIEVFYLQEKPTIDEGPFLKEERALLDTIADTVARIIEKQGTANELRALNQQLQANDQQLRSANQQLMAANQQLEANEKQLYENFKQFKSLFDGIEDVIYVSDPETYEIVHVNDTSKKIWGKDITGEKCYKVLQNRESPCPFCTNNIIFNEKPGETYVWEFQNEVSKQWFRCSDKVIDWPDGRKLRFELASDITYIKKIEENLKESEKLFRLIAENSSEMIYLMSIPNGEYEYVSPAASKVFGYEPEDFYNTPVLIQEAIHPKWKSFFEKEWGLLLEGKYSPTYEYQIKTKEGKVKWIFQGNTLLLDEEGKPEKILGVVSDCTERKKQGEKLKKLNKELAQKTEELQQILYITTHDLRSPLVNIQGFSKELKVSSDRLYELLKVAEIQDSIFKEYTQILEEEIPESIHYITGSTEKMDILLKGLLQISRLGRQQLSLSNISVNKLIQEVINSYKYEIDKNNIYVEVGDLPSCNGDYMQIYQLFANIMGNAIKFLKDDQPGEIRIQGVQIDDYVHYIVQDNGIGIDPKFHSKVFDLFQKLDNNKQGSGLGMNIMKQIAEKHNGEIMLDSELGKGTRITVKLPAANQ